VTSPQTGTVTTHDVRYFPDDIWEGSIRHERYQDADTEQHEDLSVEEVVELIRNLGLMFAGNRWASNPDGSVTSDYSTGEQCEVTAHLTGFTAAQTQTIVACVDAW
jgi:predicted transcriptional regulator